MARKTEITANRYAECPDIWHVKAEAMRFRLHLEKGIFRKGAEHEAKRLVVALNAFIAVSDAIEADINDRKCHPLKDEASWNATASL